MVTKEESWAEIEKYGIADWWKREGKWDTHRSVAASPRMDAIMRAEGWESAEERIAKILIKAHKEGKL